MVPLIPRSRYLYYNRGPIFCIQHRTHRQWGGRNKAGRREIMPGVAGVIPQTYHVLEPGEPMDFCLPPCHGLVPPLVRCLVFQAVFPVHWVNCSGRVGVVVVVAPHKTIYVMGFMCMPSLVPCISSTDHLLCHLPSFPSPPPLHTNPKNHFFGGDRTRKEGGKNSPVLHMVRGGHRESKRQVPGVPP